MKANETRVEDFLSNNKTQFVIPVYQRNYDWNEAQCRQLMEDVFTAGADKDTQAHFIGSIVYIHDDVYTSSRMKELVIIDGQQRLTTLTLIYLAMYKLAQEMEDAGLEQEINETYLINKFASEDEKLKLKPTENNAAAFRFLIRSYGNEQFPGYSRVIANYEFFKCRITPDNYEYVLNGLSKLMFVEISLDRGKDDPQRIFESLNSTGLELSQADLIRNYILMGLKPKDQERIYQDYWSVIEAHAKHEESNVILVSEFIRDYLTLKNKKIPNKGKVYEAFKEKYPTSDVATLGQSLADIKKMVVHYHKLNNPARERDVGIRLQLEYIKRLEINVAYPFLMQVYDDYSQKVIDKDTFVAVLELVQNFAWRRFILGLPTNALNKIFMSLYEKLEPDFYLYSLQKWLVQRQGAQRFPSDYEVFDALRIKDLYNIKTKNRVYLLERLENHNNNEYVQIEHNEKITTEHIFPQNPDPKWKLELGEEQYKQIRDNYLNTLANLTLSGNNGKLGNKSFIAKRDLSGGGYKDSRLWLNKFLGDQNGWDVALLEKRFELLAERFFEVWTYPDIGDAISAEPATEVSIFEAEDPRHKKLEYAIFLESKMEVSQVSKLYINVISELFNLTPELFYSTDLGDRVGLTHGEEEAKQLRQPSKINENYFIETNLDNVGKFERIKHALSIFDLEDELTIKYAAD
ncbi:hypothetical protein LCGC14_0143670 [marine sediment metagenome]|uniref:DUF262 domain-containing protein n=1 Tax=marine sediment metagenome TaxID=412755 RepID=A0A0F9Y220_9ZZZZ